MAEKEGAGLVRAGSLDSEAVRQCTARLGRGEEERAEEEKAGEAEAGLGLVAAEEERKRGSGSAAAG